MSRGARWIVLTVIAAAAIFAAWRIIGLMQAEAALQRDDAVTALRWRPDDPRALLMRAEARFAAKDMKGATSSANTLLQISPTDGRGYRILAQVAQSLGNLDQARVLFAIAGRRAPRDLVTRAWLAQDALLQGNYSRALGHIDAVLTMSPGAGRATLPVLVKLAEDPAFANALSITLAAKPDWRPALMELLAAPENGNPIANDLVLAALQRNGGLDTQETGAWLDSLMRQGRWGEAYARWVAASVTRGNRLPLLFNGDFAKDPSGIGFDWKVAPVSGLILGFEPAAGVDGRAAHLRFLGRRVSGTFLSHPLLLSPGRYRLQWRERADALRGDPGVEWNTSCAGAQSVLARSTPSVGEYSWRSRSLHFEVASVDCSGQWLRLGPAGPLDSGQIVSGDLWLASVIITRL